MYKMMYNNFDIFVFLPFSITKQLKCTLFSEIIIKRKQPKIYLFKNVLKKSCYTFFDRFIDVLVSSLFFIVHPLKMITNYLINVKKIKEKRKKNRDFVSNVFC